MVVTNSYFTKQAQNLAKKNNVELWNRDALIKNLLKTKSKETYYNNSKITIKTIRNKCSICNKKLTDKEYKYCISNKNRFKGNLYCFKHQRRRS